MLSPALVDKCVTFAAAAAAGCCICWYRCPFDVISDSRRYFEIIFSVSPGHVEKDPSLIAWSRVILVGSNSWRSTSLVFYPALVDNCVTFAAATAAGCFLCWSRCPLEVIHDSGRYLK